MTAQVHLEDQEPLRVARIRGEVDAANAGTVAAQLRAGLTNAAHGLVVDLSETEYMDSSGLNMLMSLHEDMTGRQQQLIVAVPDGSHIRRLLDVVRLTDTLAVQPDVRSAQKAGRRDTTL